MSAEELSPEQEKALQEAQQKPVTYNTLQDGNRKPGTDFTGNLTDFQFTFACRLLCSVVWSM